MTNKVDCLKLINFIERSNLFTTNQIRNKKLLIAFSGGQDSSCLLMIFYILSKKWDFKLGAVYCNHCWDDSTQTSSSVFENLQRFDIPFYFVESPNSEPMKPEQKARNWRYSAFYTISKWENYDLVLTGHTLSDSVETTLFNLFRGSGLKGICSLKENQNLDDLKTNDFFFKNKKMEKQNSNLFQFYLKKRKEFQNTDKLNSFITLFKPLVLKKRSKVKKWTFQIQRLIRKKEKEKPCMECKAERILSSSFFKLINKHTLLSSQLEKKGLKLIKQLRINQDKKVLLQSSFLARESLLLCKAIPNSATLHGMPSFVFEQLAKPYINGKRTGKQINAYDHLEVLIDKLVQKVRFVPSEFIN